MKNVAWILCLSTALAFPVFAQGADPAPAPAVQHDVVQLAILLDTSNSMDGLIGQAKSQLWQIVNEIVKHKVPGHQLDLQVALFQYGTPSLGEATGYIRLCVPMTDDLDRVSAELQKLTTNGGDEFCGWVIKDAVEKLTWSADKNAYRAILIAGNEPFTQGPVDYRDTCKEALSHGIVVHTIFCGPEREGIDSGWKDGAFIATGSYSFINQDTSGRKAAAPQDKHLVDLGTKLNATYLPYGTAGKTGAANQAAQDKVADDTAIAAERAITKATGVYHAEGWDLVDAIKSGKVSLGNLKPEELPAEMRNMTPQQQKDYLAQKQKERDDLQAQIAKLSQERDQFLASVAPPANFGGAGAGGGAGGAGGMGGGAGGGRGGRGGGGAGGGGAGGGAGGAGGGGGTFGGAAGRAIGGRGQ